MTPALVGAFAFYPDEEPEISLSLFKTTILLKNQNKEFFIIKLVFEIKLEVLYCNNVPYFLFREMSPPPS
jgi:hypothetical protein